MRDSRIDVLRGLALLMIFVDHIPGNRLSLITLRNFGFSDAAEIFVLLAGLSSTFAYGRIFQRDGANIGLRRIGLRLARLYLFQIALLLTTLAVVMAWNARYHLQPILLRPMLDAPATVVRRIATRPLIQAMPTAANTPPWSSNDAGRSMPNRMLVTSTAIGGAKNHGTALRRRASRKPASAPTNPHR